MKCYGDSMHIKNDTKLRGSINRELTRNVTAPKDEPDELLRSCCEAAEDYAGYMLSPVIPDQYDHESIVSECTVFTQVDGTEDAKGWASSQAGDISSVTSELAQQCCEHAEEFSGWSIGPPALDIYDRKEAVAECSVYAKVDGSEAAQGWTSQGETKGKTTPLWPSWPASSPFVTSVGATRFHGDKIGNQEAAVNEEDHFGSGGGFSAMFSQPSWQTEAVSGYFKKVDASTLPDPSKVSYPRKGRATPDVSALGTAYTVYNDGRSLAGGVGGTSASAPAFAGMVSILNDARIAKGKKPLGLLNPFLYQNPDAFTDVTIGSDKWGRGGGTLPYGFNCSVGWDPVTGLGTPKFAALLKAALEAP